MTVAKYSDLSSNVAILQKADMQLQEIYTNIPEEELKNIKIEVCAEHLLEAMELLLAFAETYEAFVPAAPVEISVSQAH